VSITTIEDRDWAGSPDQPDEDALVARGRASGQVAVLFSGGTDSTLTSALVQERFETVHLVTYNRMGFHSTENTGVNAQMLKDRYGDERFVHEIIRVEKLFKWISYERYLQNIYRHGLYMLSTCGLCKLAMHMRTVKYCVDHGIHHVADGANQAMSMFPAQMKPVIEKMQEMYEHFGVTYGNPVFELEGHDEQGYVDDANSQFLGMGLGRVQDTTTPTWEPPPRTLQPARNTAGERLFQIGLAPMPDVKGSKYDQKRQPRCFQFILFNMFAIKYFTAEKSYEEYRDGTVQFFEDKIDRATQVLEAHFEKGKHAKLFE